MRKFSKRAFTLPELLISMTILSVIGSTLVFLYDGSYATVNRGTGKLALQQKGRETLKRAAPLVLSAFDNPDDPNDSMIEWPPQDGAKYDALVLTTTEDWLAATYPDAATSARLAPDVASINHFNYRLRLEAGNVLLERGDWDEPTSTFAPSGERRALGYSSAPDAVDAVAITGLRVEKLAANAVRLEIDLRVRIRNAAKTGEDVQQTMTSVIQIPNASLRAL